VYYASSLAYITENAQSHLRDSCGSGSLRLVWTELQHSIFDELIEQ